MLISLQHFLNFFSVNVDCGMFSRLRISLEFQSLIDKFVYFQTHGVRVGQESAKKAIGFVEVCYSSYFPFGLLVYLHLIV